MKLYDPVRSVENLHETAAAKPNQLTAIISIFGNMLSGCCNIMTNSCSQLHSTQNIKHLAEHHFSLLGKVQSVYSNLPKRILEAFGAATCSVFNDNKPVIRFGSQPLNTGIEPGGLIHGSPKHLYLSQAQ
ncbi:hypothetical protein M514_04432 [Trichuris suis]|uniref:Uncharacterized protein n=1 Tax=Trichuris suis TaxID=68888 RepID=A0A085MZ42_9BILA|nr:hypothetical protein M514_04432 [Trichuris suis]